jgi:hypothetical protein
MTSSEKDRASKANKYRVAPGRELGELDFSLAELEI